MERSGQPDWLTGGARYRRAKHADFYVRHVQGPPMTYDVIFYHSGSFTTVEVEGLATLDEAEREIQRLLATGDYRVRVN